MGNFKSIMYSSLFMHINRCFAVPMAKLLPIMLALCSMLLYTHYAKNYAGIIDTGLFDGGVRILITYSIYSHFLFLIKHNNYVIRHEKTGLMYTKYTNSYKTEYLHYCTSYFQSASCIRFCRNDCISG